MGIQEGFSTFGRGTGHREENGNLFLGVKLDRYKQKKYNKNSESACFRPVLFPCALFKADETQRMR
jgi:hypothetical protein